jgi:nitroreductase
MIRSWNIIFGGPNPASYTHSSIPLTDLQVILRAAFQSDTDLFANPWRLVVITDPSHVLQVADAMGSEPLKLAPVLVAIGVDKQKSRQGLVDFVNRLDEASPASEQHRRYKTATEDSQVLHDWLTSAIAHCSMRLTLASKAMGYPATIYEILPSEQLRLVVSAPAGIEILALVSIGQPVAQRRIEPQGPSAESLIFSNDWDHPFPFTEPGRDIVYRDSLVSYFDILGFKNVVASSPPDRIVASLEELLSLSSHDPQLIRVTSRGLSAFSDHIVRTVSLDGLSAIQSVDVIEFELTELQHIQANLAVNGVFVRGAITRGPIYIDEDLVFGPALIRAYELEQTIAVHPRIVIDPTLLERLAHDANLDERLSVLYTRFLFQGDDTVHSVDYLQIGDHLSERLDLLKTHASLVRKALSEATLPSVTSKYLWLASYHDRIVSHVSDADLAESGISRSDLLIGQ